MKFALAIAAALTFCGSAFAAGVVDTVKQDAHQIGSSFRQDAHRIASGETYRDSEAADQRRMHSNTTAMGAGPETNVRSTGRQARMDAAYANWQRSHR
jgi:hypothetical protein